MPKRKRQTTLNTMCDKPRTRNKRRWSTSKLLFEHLEQRQVLSTNWAGVFGGAGYDSANGIDVAADGATYVVGQFADGTTIDFDLENNGGELTSQQSGNQRFPSQDGFLAKFDESGGFLWSVHAQNTSDLVVHDVAVDSQGNAYVVGHFRDEAAFYMDGVLQGSLTDLFGDASESFFLSRLSFDTTLPVGERFQVEWAQHHDGNGLMGLTASPLAGNLFLTGYFSGALNLGGFEITSNESAQDGYLVTLDAETGHYLAAESFGGFGSERPYKSLTVGPHGEVALTGSTTSPTLTLPGSSNTFQLAGGGEQDMFVAVLTPATSSPPEANAGLEQVGQEDQLLTFNASACSDPDGDPLTYRWDFGDGTTAEATSPTVNHAYAYGGDFVVTLMVLDGNGNAATDTTTATVSEVNDAPVANAGGPYSGFATQPVTFDASASFDLDNEDGSTANDQTLQYFWDFGDGGTATTSFETVEYTYAAAGSYSVSLTVSDGIVSSFATAAPSITSAPAGDPTTIYVWNIEDQFESRQRGRNTDYRVVLNVFQDSDGDGVAEQSDGGISGVQVAVELRDASGALLTTLTGETDSNGTFHSDWIKGLAPGQYSAEVIDLALESFNWFDGLLDVEDEQLLFV